MKTCIASAVVIGALTLGGCGGNPKTESEKTQMRADNMNDAAGMIRQGESEVANGKAEVARGQAMKDQGDTRGDAIIAAGQAMQKSGEAKMDQGKRLKDKN